jgi:hypothetical protein
MAVTEPFHKLVEGARWRDAQVGDGAYPERVLRQHLRDPLLEPVDRRILAELIVADLGSGHRLPHFVGGPRHRVGAEVDHGRDRIA